ncbi:hypothetical protein GCM10027347_17770 [Larkinella harenae]
MTSIPALLTHLPAQLSLNPIVVNIEAVSDATYPDRGGLRYYCQVMVPESYLSATYQELVRLEGAEVPAVAAGPGKLYQGAFFEVQNQLDPLLERTAPDFGRNRIFVADQLVMPYYCVLTVENNDVEIFRQTLPVQHVVKAGINEVDYAAYKDLFFTDYIGRGKRFLTWAPDYKTVHPEQPEFLYYLTNFTPSPTALKLCYRVFFEDHTELTGCASELSNVLPFTVYGVPVGPQALGFDQLAGRVLSYEVWLANQNDRRISEIRSYQLEQEYRRNVRFVLFANSLGGFDTLCLTGQGEESIGFKRSISERFNGWQFLPSYAEREINDVSGLRELKVATGWLDSEGLRYLEELLFSRELYLVTDRAFVPLLPVGDQFQSRIDDEYLIGRTLTFQYANNETAFSALPDPASLFQRPTGWRPKAMACLVDAFGKRTGKRQATVLEQYYLDDNSKVVGVPLKSNVPGTDGYIPPMDSDSCLVTPYLNSEINRQGTFRRLTCPDGQSGGPATIVIAAGTYGSEISQDDAQAKAEAAFRRLNTQDYANEFGTCLSEPEKYALAVPAGHWHYRVANPSGFAVQGLVFNNPVAFPEIGNVWMAQGQNRPYVFPMNSNDLDFPISYPSNAWRIMVYGPAGTQRRVRVYQNGILRLNYLLSMNNDGYEYTFLTSNGGNSFVLANGDRIYLTNTAD